MKKNYTEEDLVSHILSRDTKRFGIVYDYYSPALFGIIKQIVKDEDISEDVLQDSFLKIWNSASSYNPKKSRLFTWVLNVTRNTAIDYLRSKQGKFDKKNLTSESMLNLIEKKGTSDISHEHIGLKNVVSELKKEQKQIIDLAFLILISFFFMILMVSCLYLL